MTDRISLAGAWKLSVDAEQKNTPETLIFKEEMTLPSTTAQSGIGTVNPKRETGYLTERLPFSGTIWLQREIRIPEAYRGLRCFLYLERTRMTKLYVNGTCVGSRDSLAAPHCYEITDAICFGASNTLLLEIRNTDYPTRGGHMTSPDTQTNWIGVTGALFLSFSQQSRLSRLRIFSDSSNTIRLTGILEQASTAHLELSANVWTEHSKAPMSLPCSAVQIQAESDGNFSVNVPLGENVQHWSEYTPVCYELLIQYNSDCYTVPFGLRSLTVRDTAFLADGKPTFLRGKHDGLLFPLTGAAPTDLKSWIRVFHIAKEWGINHYRFHTCCPPEAAFFAADLTGIYLEPELPFWGTMQAPDEEGYQEAEQTYLIEEAQRILDAFGNHPSFAMFSLGNELWGNPVHLGNILRTLKAYDPRPLYTQGSNNFQFFPTLLEEDDFFCGVRLDRQRLFRGSYAMCDAPLGHVQTTRPSTMHDYDRILHPETAEKVSCSGEEEIEIQYGTGVKKVKKSAVSGCAFVPAKPVISHEIGQYYIYPDYQQIPKFTGVLEARNFEIYRERLEAAGMGNQAEEFFLCSGKLAVQCYQEELEAAFRTETMAGFQLLDLQDFTGQNTALVGVLDAFLDSKGLVSSETWRSFCSDAVLLARFPDYVLEAGQPFSAKIQLRHTRPNAIEGTLQWKLSGSETLASGSIPLAPCEIGLTTLGTIYASCPDKNLPEELILELTLPEAGLSKQYTLYGMPKADALPAKPVAAYPINGVWLTQSLSDALELLQNGKRVLLFPTQAANAVPGDYCTDFWNYTMFRQISESMNKALPVGTLGLCIDSCHPALGKFPCRRWTTPQWHALITHGSCAVLDGLELRPIVQMIDNVERNHKLGLLFEGQCEHGKLLVCMSRLWETESLPEVRQYFHSLLSYAASDSFAPQAVLTAQQLTNLFSSEGI